MEKRGISAIVATVMIILIVVAGVGIIWRVILPLFEEARYLSYSDTRLNIVIKGYTVYYPEEHFAFVQIERGNDEINLTGLEIGFNFEGTTRTYQTMAVPGPNGKYTYKFNFTKDLIEGIPEKVTVAPVFILNNKIKLGGILDEKNMPSGMVHLSVIEWINANNAAAENILKETTSGGTVPFCGDGNIDAGESCDDGDNSEGDGCSADCEIELTTCGPLDEEGKTYVLMNDITEIPGNCFNITANEIVLDGNNYLIKGTGEDFGIYAEGRKNITIKNINTEKFHDGIYLYYSETCVIKNVLSQLNNRGILLNFAPKNTLEDITLISNQEGIRILSSPANNMTNITAISNIKRGIGLYSSNCIVTNSTLNLHDTEWYSEGILLGASSENNTIENNKFNLNKRGIYIDGPSKGNIIKNNILTLNKAGIHLYGFSCSKNYFENNSIYGQYQSFVCEALNPAPAPEVINIDRGNTCETPHYTCGTWLNSSLSPTCF